MNSSKIIYHLPSIAVLECATVKLYIASGTHILDGTLNFTDSVKQTLLSRTPNSRKSTVICSRNSLIRFSESREVLISGIVIKQCELHFYYASYTLGTVVVMNSEGCGIFAKESPRQEITDCTFENNTREHIKISLRKHTSSTRAVKLTGTKLSESKGAYAVYISIVWTKATVSIRNNSFESNAGTGLCVSGAKHFRMTGCLFISNHGDGIDIKMITGAIANDSIVVEVSNCSVKHNARTGITVDRNSRNELMPMHTEITNVTFINNSRALYLLFGSWDEKNYHRVTKVSECHFYSHKPSPLYTKHYVALVKSDGYLIKNNEVIIENCSFKGNEGVGDCSVLYVDLMNNIKLNNVDISDNQCTGLMLSASMIKLVNHLNITRNSGWLGGAISLLSSYFAAAMTYSQLLLTESSVVDIINNTAETYGGGIFSNETCERRSYNGHCFLQIVKTTPRIALMVTFSGNRAKLGGDSVLGGCLSNCSIQLNGKKTNIDQTDPNNVFWKLVALKNRKSQSTLVEYPKGAMFCTNTSTNASTLSLTCNKFYNITAFRGQTFTVPLMAGDSLCFPSKRVLKVRGKDNTSQLLEEQVLETSNYCSRFPYTVSGVLSQNRTEIEFTFQDPFAFAVNNMPAVLTVDFSNCPPGLTLNYSTEQCKCHERFKITCHSGTFTLEIPAQTWVGNYKDFLIVQSECQHCAGEASERSINDIIADKFCTANRSGILCGQCVEGYSLMLGGYECAQCSKSPLVGVVLVVAFGCTGAVLVLLLLRLDLTISTGALNGLIFYSNVVYLSSDIFLPTSNMGSVHLQNAVKILLTFLAWMNLDFGISTCFFDGYNTYLSTWMQFVFPLYIWVLILIIVFASRYSTIVAKITTSNTVPVLATLLLLSYAKLLKISIKVFSSVRLFSLDGKLVEIVWKQDGNIPYLGQHHILLFLMSLLMVILYIVPFTLLVLLGPLMRAKSHYRIFRWIHKIKPFLDAFYGCYTVQYRYWPGVVLLCRVAIIGIFSFYSANDSPFKLITISMMVLILFVFWQLIGRTRMTSFYRKRAFNYFELFFLTI